MASKQANIWPKLGDLGHIYVVPDRPAVTKTNACDKNYTVQQQSYLKAKKKSQLQSSVPFVMKMETQDLYQKNSQLPISYGLDKLLNHFVPRPIQNLQQYSPCSYLCVLGSQKPQRKY